MKKGKIIGMMMLSAAFVGALASCGVTSNTNNTNSNTSNSSNVINVPSATDSSKVTAVVASETAKDALDNKTEITSDFNISTTDGEFVVENNIYKITKAGIYELSGSISEGMIYVDSEGEVELDLNGVSIKSSTNSPIYAINVDTLKIKAMENTYNEIIDNRVVSLTDTLGTASIYSESDLKIVGKGSLYVSGLYNNGIHSKDDLDIKNVTLNVKAYNNAIKGNDSINIESGNIIAISTGGDGLKTTSSDISSKGNQRGIVSISGGVVDIYACEDGIDSSYDVEISNEAIVNIYTSTYSSYSSTHATSASSEMYLMLSNSYYSSSYRYSAYLCNNDGTYKWVDLSYAGMQSSTSGNNNRPGATRSSYYYYKFELPTGYTNIAFYRFLSSQTENSTTNYSSVTSGGTINTNRNMYQITSISGTKISGDWSTYSVSNNEYSAKGIKADNEINILGGDITISSIDDALHANYGLTLENGDVGLGNININGGNIVITAGDDGMHADGILTINDGLINIVNSHEGLEANQIYVKGGTSYVYGNDDGVNATSGAKTTLIEVSGGYLDVTVGSGDTDGIDSNGSYKQTGGFVITKNPTSDTSGNMAALDIDGTFTMTGGTFISLGPVSTTPSNYNYVLFGSSAGGSMWGGPGMGMGQSSSKFQFTKGTYTISELNISFEIESTYYSLFIASSDLAIGSSYTLSGPVTKTWTQNSKATTITS